MNILFLCHRIPFPPNKGDKIRSYHLLVALAREHAVDLVTHVDDPRDLRHQQILADMCRSVHVFPLNGWVGHARVLLALPTRTPLSVAYMTRPAARRRIRELMNRNRYDAIVGYSSQVGAYLARDHEGPLVVMDLVDVDSEKWAALGASRGFFRGFLSRVEARRLRRFEAWLDGRSDRLVVTTPREADLFARKVSGRRPAAITNGVVMPARVPSARKGSPPLIVFVGTMDYEPNVDAVEFGAREVLPLVRAEFQDARFRIVGRAPSPRVRALASLPGVEVTGEVPDLSPHLEEASLSLVPLRVARGVQNKVLEALAHGVPVVASPDVLACLEPEAAGIVKTGADAHGLSAAILELLRDPVELEALARRSRDYVLEHHDWARIDDQWRDLFLDVMRPREAAPGALGTSPKRAR